MEWSRDYFLGQEHELGRELEKEDLLSFVRSFVRSFCLHAGLETTLMEARVYRRVRGGRGREYFAICLSYVDEASCHFGHACYLHIVVIKNRISRLRELASTARKHAA